MSKIKIKSALISVYHKDNLEPILHILNNAGVKLYSTGGTQSFIENLGIPVTAVEDLTGYPSILGGRVKTLHPKVFGGILGRRKNESDTSEMKQYEIPAIDLVLVDLYPFEATLASGAEHDEIIEKIDIGGISLIRAAAKNFNDVLIVSSMDQYNDVAELLSADDCKTTLNQRQLYAAKAFDISSHYDTAIFQYLNSDGKVEGFKNSTRETMTLRYGENPHQKGFYYGKFNDMFEQLHGKEISYNNLVDIDAAVSLIEEFEDDTAFAILKHTNACGCATGETVQEAYTKAFEADTISAFGGVLITNKEVDAEAAEEINKLFFEILVAPSFSENAIDVLRQKKNRILLVQKQGLKTKVMFKSLLNGIIAQDRDLVTDSEELLKTATKRKPTKEEVEALLFASKICKHTKSNTIILANKGQLLASGVGQTSRVDALKQAIEKARHFGFILEGAVMASDAFFPFSDCVDIACKAGIKAVIQPGGSVRDKDSIDYCDAHEMAMVLTGIRHFKH
ncbi:MAG: bifunctional phosphoribosylaminoimidazolecarboxamide formyltransferase/IMP cyclohydrolase [Cyclobacteriaceae bacterium]